MQKSLLMKADGPPGASSNGFNENLTLFASGKAATWVDATSGAGPFDYYPQLCSSPSHDCSSSTSSKTDLRLPSFNCSNLEMARAVVEAAILEDAPVMIQTDFINF
jgi:ABC-type glycerol-3-phosphate transport system substrate-binding protein